jgi:hypothetical protein
MKKHILEGKTILDIKIADDKEAIKFITNEGDVICRVDADCCSHSWVESIELPAGGFPAQVLKAEDLDLNKPDVSDDEYECLQFYGFKISTNKGDIIIDYRNSSNGYYGGSLSWPDESYFYGGVYGQNISTENWINIKE